jgi:hypothetical protein
MNASFVEYSGIAALTVVEIATAFCVTILVDTIFNKTEDAHKHTLQLLVECCLIAAMLMVVLKFLANLLHKIPTVNVVKQTFEWREFPLLYVFGFLFCDVLQDKVERLRRRTLLHATHEEEVA